ncbi:uncharacterized protein LOC100906183 [Galendromus occidentalis]|uniref:Uncharacterized protein LOC100906183 n=1 Tax=Galendromus occidentalis TaxID=34638 RepID=A0AAJ7PAX7_9ACAR|nr:uncharacterized protein LOC100906183 [Galendromus occidentalis]
MEFLLDVFRPGLNKMKTSSLLMIIAALLAGMARGESCVCSSFWECTSTGGSPVGLCDEDPIQVCCLDGDPNQAKGLGGEMIGPVFRVKSEVNPGRESPPPPVRLFGDRRVTPLISSIFRDSIPVRRLRTTHTESPAESSEDRKSLDAFPQNLVSPPEIINPLPADRNREFALHRRRNRTVIYAYSSRVER